MKNKKQKQKDLESLRQIFEGSPYVFVTNFSKLTVGQDYELRKTVRDSGGNYRVIKNTLAEKASEGTAAEELARGLAGMTSLAYTGGDPVALAKALTTFAKNNPAFTFRAGIVEGRAVDAKAIQALATLPSREQILAQLLYLIQAPAQRLVTALNGVGRNLAVVLDQGCKENKFSS